LAPQFINHLYKQKHRKGDNDKADDGVNEDADINRHGTRCLGKGNRFVGTGHFAIFQNKKEIRKINIPQKQTDGWHDDILDKRIDNGAEGRPDDNSNSHIHDVSSHRKFFEFL
jgi:hypothetical protein